MGTYNFAAGTSGYVHLSDDYTGTYVIADAVRFILTTDTDAYTLHTFEYSVNGAEGPFNAPATNGDSSGCFSSGWTNNSGSNYWAGETFAAATAYSFTWDTTHADLAGLDTDQDDVQIKFTVRNTLTQDSTGYLVDSREEAISASFIVDNAAPAGLSDLYLDATTSTTATLKWTAASDSYWTGVDAGHYEIFYGTDKAAVEGKTASEWDDTVAGGGDTDLALSSTTDTTITGLDMDNNTYYFKIWAVDDYGNEATSATCLTSGNNTTGENYTWDNSSADGLWSNPLNWSSDAVPGAGDNVIFDATSNTACTADVVVNNLASISLNTGYTSTVTLNTDFVSSSNTLTLSGNLTVNSGTILCAGDTTQGDADNDSVIDGIGIVINAANVMVDTNGTISANGQGFPKQQSSPGTGTGPYWGAGYGGQGGAGNNSAGGSTYGSLSQPTSLGSGGANVISGAGGGAIKLNVTGNLTVNGTVSANGIDYSSNNGSGGSGGSIWLIAADTLAGSGTITADGGKSHGEAGGGGGGQISLEWTTRSFSGSLSAKGGSVDSPTSYPVSGSHGTIWVPTDKWSELWNSSYHVNGSIALAPNAHADVPAAYTFGDLVIDSGVSLECQSDTSTTNGTGVIINASNIDIPATSEISADRLGFPRAQGPGAGTGPYYAAGHGGQGGSGLSSTGGPIYGSVSAPTSIGSGAAPSTSGAGGGGAIKLNVTGSLTVNGTVSAKGDDYHGAYRGGGAGGSIWLISDTLAGSGTLFAGGGLGRSDGGGGGGGRIAVYFSHNSSSLSASASVAGGGVASRNLGQNGEDGTIVFSPIGGYTADHIIPQAQCAQSTEGDGKVTVTFKAKDPGDWVNEEFSGTMIIVDDADGEPDVTMTAGWSSSSPAYAYNGSLHYILAGTGSETVTFRPTISVAGDYKVYAWWHAHANRATDVPYTIYYNGGSETVDVNQEINGAQWNLLGTYNFAADTSGYVVLSDDSNDSEQYIIADAVKFALTPDPATQEYSLHTFEYSVNGATGPFNAPTNADSSGCLSSGWTDNSGSNYTAAESFADATAYSFTFDTDHADVTGLDSVDQNDVQIKFTLRNTLTQDATTYYVDSREEAVSASFTVDNVAPSGLANLAVSAIDATSASLTWTAATDTYFNHYEIWYGTSSGVIQDTPYTEWDNGDDSDLATAATADTTISATFNNTDTYYFKIWAYDDYGNSATTTEAQADRISGTAYTWDNGGVDSNWSTAGNWNPDGIPGVGDNVVFNSTSNTPCTADVVLDNLASISLNTGYTSTVTLNSDFVGGSNTLTLSGDLTVNSGTILCKGDTTQGDADGDSVIDGIGIVINAANVLVDTNGTISADEEGFPEEQGPGYVAPNWDGWSWAWGASHGGRGGGTAANQGASISTYGSVSQPTSLGSGGHGYSTGIGGSGGGAIKLNASGTLTINGTVSADGEDGGPGAASAGGGSGGSIWLICDTFAGSGTISADGGDAYWIKNAGSGGGGRISLQWTSGNKTFNGTFRADGSLVQTDASNGTIYVPSNLWNELWNASNHVTADIALAAGTYNIDELHIDSNATLECQGDISGTNGSGVIINATNCSIEGTLSAYGLGFLAEQGPGCDGAYRTGGGHGGTGGNSSASVYGSLSEPVSLGSGGDTDGPGGSGGGAIKLNVSGTLTINGTVSADGYPGYRFQNGTGGAGGSIRIITDILTGSGALSAKGGQAWDSFTFGGGGGGRIAVSFSHNTSSIPDNTTVAEGSLGGRRGDPGTIVFSPIGGYTDENVIPAAQCEQSTDGDGVVTITFKAKDPGDWVNGAYSAKIITDSHDGEPDVTFVGTWTEQPSNASYYNSNGYYLSAPGTGSITCAWRPTISTTGDYKVYAWWPAGATYATDAPYTIYYNGGSETIDCNQTTNGSQWNLLGTYNFAAGTEGYVVLSDDYTGTYLIADAIWFEGSTDEYTLHTFEYAVDGGGFTQPTNLDGSACLIPISGAWKDNSGADYIAGETFGAAPEYSFTWDSKHADLSGNPLSGEHDVQIKFTVRNTLTQDSTGYNIDSREETISASFTVDNVAPSAPTGLDLATEDDTGESDSDDLTNQTTGLTISGSAEADSTVELFDGATSKGTTTATGGAWSLDIALDAGERSLTATAEDAAGNVSTASTALVVTVDTTAPTVTDANISITSTPTGENSTYIVGDTVTAQWDNSGSGDNNTDIASATCDFSSLGGGSSVTMTESSGVYSASYDITTSSVTGSHAVSVTATDDAANSTTTPDTTSIAVGAGTLSLTSPDPDTTHSFKVGATCSIEWTAAGDTSSVIIKYSTDSGSTYPNTINTVVSSAGSNSYDWTVPYDLSTQVRLRIEDAAAPATNTFSNVDFSIVIPTITIIAPNGSEQWYANSTQDITWEVEGDVSHVKLEYSTDGGSTYPHLIAAAAPSSGASGSYSWQVPFDVCSQVKVRGTDASGLAAIAISGAASAKVSADNSSYEDTNKTLVLDVLTDFAAGDSIVVSGGCFSNFSVSDTDNLELEIYNSGFAYALDDKTIRVVGPSQYPYTGGSGDGWDSAQSGEF